MDYVDKEHKKLVDVYMCRNEEGYVLTEIIKIVHINIAEMYNICYNKPEEMEKYDEYMQDTIRLGACNVTNKEEEFQNLLSKVDADSIIKHVMEEMVDNMKNDEELCVLFYDREEEQKKIWDSIKAELEEKAMEEAHQKAQELAKEMAEDIAKEMVEDIAKEMAEDLAKEMAKKRDVEMVINMKNAGLSYKRISEYTKLSVDEIEKLIK